MDKSSSKLSQPYREMAQREASDPPSPNLKKAARIFALAGTLFVGYEMLKEEGRIESELKSNPYFVEMQKLEKIKRDVQDAQSALFQSPLLVLPVCSEEGKCAFIFSPEIDPNIGRARSFILDAIESARGFEDILVHLNHISVSLPLTIRNSDDGELCRASITELESVGKTVDSQIVSKQESMSSRTKTLIAEKDGLIVGLLVSLFAVLCLSVPHVKNKKREQSEDDTNKII